MIDLWQVLVFTILFLGLVAVRVIGGNVRVWDICEAPQQPAEDTHVRAYGERQGRGTTID